jgi:hypothetical protein
MIITIARNLLYLTAIGTGILIEGVTVARDQLVQIATQKKSKKETWTEKETTRRIAVDTAMIVADMRIEDIVKEEGAGAGVGVENVRGGIGDVPSHQMVRAVMVWIVIGDVIISLAANKTNGPQHHSTDLNHLTQQTFPPLTSKFHPSLRHHQFQ